MPTTEELHYLELRDVGRQIQSRERSSEEVTRAIVTRIESVDRHLHSYSALMLEQAFANARRADQEIAAGHRRGPLQGVPIAVKDLLWTRDAPTAHGMALHRDHRPAHDATVVRRLHEAGAVILGKLQQTEGAFAEHHPRLTAPLNPWDPALWSGISSSGSGVATAAGLCFGSLGTDTGGSIRFPCAANGVTGLKPTWGRTSRYGAFELAGSLDHIGPIARSTADAATLLACIAGPDPLDPTASQQPVPDYLAATAQGLSGLIFGIDPQAFVGIDEPTKRALQDALRTIESLGGSVREVALPDVAQALIDWRTICAVEAAVAHADTFPTRRDDYGPALAGMLDFGHSLIAIDYEKARRRRADLTTLMRAAFEAIDLLLIPANAFAAQTIAHTLRAHQDPALYAGMVRFTYPFDLTGHPTLTLPGGATSSGAPVAIQFVASHFGEDLLVRAGCAFQQETHWHQRRPPV